MPDEFDDLPKHEPAETEAILGVGANGESQAMRVVEVLDEYLAKLKAGEKPDRAKLLAENPELAEQLEACLAGLEFIHAAGDADHSQRRLGDFQIEREVGRGGMGAVYEARQISLGRRVALKILRFGGISDPDAVQRFEREAQTVASLHHTNIVPIYAVGSERGVNYFAMQFIEGRSLDQVLREHIERKESISSETIAQWGLQAAEALSHAHARGVIHRDVKPSNLLLDNDEGRLWLSDFGLAKRLDDVTLSMTGALLGTPRYMSPEQAAAAHHKLDHRTDIYSLGATLYELATGQPVFSGSSPHDVIGQIIADEPIAPRMHRPSLPRDLDTILMKCLSKEVGQRYDSALDLASDLRAFQEGRSITARRVGVIERSSRWLKRQRRSVALAGGTVAATVMLILLSVGIGYAWQRSQLASVMLRAKHPPLVAELFHDGSRAMPRITVPTQQRLEVNAGEYQMRVSGNSRLSQTIGVTLEPGSEFEKELNLDSQLLWKDVKIAGGMRLASRTDAENRTSGVDIIELGEEGIRCVSGLSGFERWELNLQSPEHDLLNAPDQLVWPWNRLLGGNDTGGLGSWDQRPWVLPSPQLDASEHYESLDLNADGHSDLLLAARHQAWVIAVNGRDGTPLWITARGETTGDEKHVHRYGLVSATLELPLVVDDYDGDGVADIVASFIYVPDNRRETQRWIELLSGKTGKSLWRHDLSAQHFAVPIDEEVPMTMRWINGGGGGSANTGSERRGYFRTRHLGSHSRTGSFQYSQSPLHLDANRSAVSTVCGTQMIQVDLQTGQLASETPVDLVARTVVPPRYGDLDGDGVTDVLLVEEVVDSSRSSQNGGSNSVPQHRLVAFSANKNSVLWKSTIEAHLPRQAEIDLPIPDWPLVVDLDDDGKCEVLVPSEATSPQAWGPPWGKLQVIDGDTGRLRWERQVFNGDQQLDSFIVGPDIDADGVSEVFVVSQWGIDLDLFVDCFSGKDGTSLWRLEQPLLMGEHEAGIFRVGQLQWYHASDDGWPQLMVPLRFNSTWEVNAGATDRVAFVSAGTGKLTHFAMDASQPQIADLDGDGADDLLLANESNEHDMHAGATLHAVRGIAREAWHRFLPPQVVVGDFDGDAVADTIQQNVVRELVARSGASGKVLWQSSIDSTGRQYLAQPAAQRDSRNEINNTVHDLNSDGVADIVLVSDHRYFQDTKRSVLRAVSGINGGRLWDSQLTAQWLEFTAMVDCRDLDGDGKAEVVTVVACDFGQPQHVSRNLGSSAFTVHNDPQLWLAVLSGTDGSLQWAKPLCERQPQNTNQTQFQLRGMYLEASYGDLNQDGVLDVVLPAQSADGVDSLTMRAMDGRDGKTLWQVPLPGFPTPAEAFGNAIPAACGDIDGDGKREVIVMAFSGDANGGPTEQLEVAAYTGSDGDELWKWQTPSQRRDNEVDNRSDRVQDRLRPLLARRRDGTSAVAFLLWNNSRDIYVIDHRGQTLSQHKASDNFFANGERPWLIDADEDGQDELLFINHQQVSLLPIDQLEQPIWVRRKAMSDMEEIIGILPSGDEKTPGRVVVQGGPNDGSLRGLDPLTGRTVWTCVGPAVERQVDAAMLSTPTIKIPPYALFQHDGEAMVRRGASKQDRFDNWTEVSREPASITPPSHDPRLLRPLPWVPHDFEVVEFQKAVSWGLFYGFTIGFLPAAFLYWRISRRRWGLKTLLFLPIIAAVVMMGLLAQPSNSEFASWEIKLYAAVMALPVLFTIVLFARWWREGKRRRIAISTLMVVMIAIGLGIYALRLDRYRTGMLQPGEGYDWSHWYYGLFPVGYWLFLMPCLAMIAFWMLRNLWRLAVSGMRRSKIIAQR